MEILFVIVFIIAIVLKASVKNERKRSYKNSDYEFVFNRKNDKNHFSNKKYNSSYFNNRKHNINQGLEKDIVEINKNQKTRYKQYTDEEKKSYGKRMKELREKGKEYEEFVAGYFKIDGYEIELHGIKNGVKDKGIDIICKKDNELILIQCKNWRADTKYKINHEKLKAFVGSCTEYINQNRLFDKNIKLKFVTSNYILDKSAEMFLKESKTLQYQIIEY
ncbi:MAG: restriction endonuclease [Aliarcobacter skirrowii]|jgi:restriction system protein|uniref:restriction endonuclease n=1 Tax=Aliarcobacter skirrowii TaxID=28200 RepID=UPI00243112D0|nr:restriction endonuclease [Aliarcobacter skirrowii]MDD2508489.1 restriction endonuclease [Aliarcobacter skirrowii]MDD3497306.1 restriction endonuclease [Aliarcobacter skirrowii]